MESKHNGAIKNVVLVHGAFADGSGWEPVAQILKSDGYKVSALCRQLLGAGTAAEPESAEETRETRESAPSITPTRVCPVCGAGRMIVIKELAPMVVGAEAHEGAGASVVFDSS